jgi:phosphate transport system substrate-binding protein
MGQTVTQRSHDERNRGPAQGGFVMNKLLVSAAAAAFATACSHNSQTTERNNIYATGSSTVFPFTRAVADRFQTAHPGLPAPLVEEIGTGAGITKFCGGVGNEFPDIADASRRMREEEVAECRAHGVTDIAELQIGMDGIAFIQSPGAPKISLTPKQIYEALAAEPYGEVQKAKSWKDVDPSLPDIPILVYGPPPGDGTHDSLNELILVPACEPDHRVVALKADKARVDEICTRLRGDGGYINAGENDEKTTISMIVNPGAIGILGYSYLEQNAGKLRAIPISGVVPSADSVRSGKYAGSRPLFLYVKKSSVQRIAGMKDFVAAYVGAIEPGGYLTQRGLIPADEGTRQATLKLASSLPPSPKTAPIKT